MNKKFKDLARRAGFTSCTPKMQSLLTAYGELIVKECADIANRLESEEKWPAPVHDIIVQHFKVNHDHEQH